MTAQALKLFIDTLRLNKVKVHTRWELDKNIYSLALAAGAIGRQELMQELFKLYNDIENIDTNTLCKYMLFEER